MNWSAAHAKLHTLLRQRVLIPKGSHLLIAVSGGQDSLCLAQLLIDLRQKWGWSLGLVHCDHSWRADSADNAAHVATLASAWQIPIWIEVADSLEKSEAAARRWRYAVFERLARSQGYSHVVTGHTQSDRAETVLYNLIRGTGTDGLGTLGWARSLNKSTNSPSIALVRPLLNFARAETKQFCQDRQIPVWEDSSNQDLSFRRNRIRHELMPYLRSHFNPQVEQALSQLAEITAADIDYLRLQADHIYRQTISEVGNGQSWQIQRQALIAEPRSLQRRVIKQLLEQVLPSPPNFEQVEKIVTLLEANNASQSDPYPGGWIAVVRKPFVYLEPLQNRT